MSWFKAQSRVILLAAALAGAAVLSGCSSLTPVYGTTGPALRQAKPVSVAEQVIYQTLATSFPVSSDGSVPEVRITTVSSERGLTLSNVSRPTAQREMVVTAVVELVDPSGTVSHRFTRSAAASFETDDQGFAGTESRREATERAARAVAETIRLSLLAALSGTGS